MSKAKVTLLVNMKDLLFDKDVFTAMFIGKVTTAETDTICHAPEPVLQQKTFGPMLQQGRKPLWQQFPTLITVVEDFIKTHSFLADGRRRKSTGTGTGVSLEQIRVHALKAVPGLSERGISRDAIHLLMVPPKKNTIRASRYKSLIDARVPGKRNNYREESPNQHFLFARNKYREEFVAMFPNDATFFSCDDMNKLKMGPAPAVSRYHQILRFFMRNNKPDLPDHDFPNPSYLIVPSGYLELIQGKTDECDEEFTRPDLNDMVGSEDVDIQIEVPEPDDMYSYDKLNRKHLKRLVAGPALIILRATIFGG